MSTTKLKNNQKTREDSFNILIVDDDELVMESFDRVFSSDENGFSVDKTTDGKHAIDLIEKRVYDLVITDLVMPEIDGIQVLRKVKKANPDTEVILITAYSSSSSILDAMYFGASNYITKPIDPAELRLHVKRAITRRKSILERDRKIAELERLSYTLAHDFKASLLSIRGFARILLNDYSDKLNGDGQFLLYRINANVSTMESMIEGLLEYAKIGKLEINPENINTAKLINKITENFKPILKENHIDLIIEKQLPDVYFYRNGLLTIFANLIDNAIKYARYDAESYIKIGVSKERVNSNANQLLFYIEDNGVGIPQKNLKLVFDIFQRCEKIMNKNGYGMGLAIVKKVLESMNCGIHAESEPGEKTTLYFTLPKKNLMPTNKPQNDGS
ncbi:MAG: response regulator [Spirochaetes bacterium]|nr:response regulator [Spirochaetota bacterium]